MGYFGLEEDFLPFATKDEASLKVSKACVELAQNQPDVAVQLAKEAQVPRSKMATMSVGLEAADFG